MARTFGPSVRVLELATASKAVALNAGDNAARAFPRFYLDADVVLTIAALRGTAKTLESGDYLAAAPAVYFDLRACTAAVRAFYSVWSLNPYFDNAKVGSGVYAVNKSGHDRISAFPEITADDEFFRLLFDRSERVTLPDHRFTVFPPRTLRDVIHVKTRVRRGNLELRQTMKMVDHKKWWQWLGFSCRLAIRPWLWPAIPVYASVVAATYARMRFASGPQTTVWERDLSSRPCLEQVTEGTK